MIASNLALFTLLVVLFLLLCQAIEVAFIQDVSLDQEPYCLESATYGEVNACIYREHFEAKLDTVVGSDFAVVVKVEAKLAI